jgi:hypothetical protein
MRKGEGHGPRTFLDMAIGGCGILLHDAVNGGLPCQWAERPDLVVAHGERLRLLQAAIDASRGIKILSPEEMWSLSNRTWMGQAPSRAHIPKSFRLL